jgi:integrase
VDALSATRVPVTGTWLRHVPAGQRPAVPSAYTRRWALAAWHERRGHRSSKDRRRVRTINLLPVLRDELREHKARGEHTANQLVFATSTGRAVTATNVRKRILQPAIARASETLERQDEAPLPDGITPHALRRTFASLLFAIGESPPYVINQLGHATPALTLEIYARQMNQRDGEPARLQDLVEGRLQPGVGQTRMFQ